MTKTVVKSASVPKTTVTQTITRKRVVKSNGQIVEETEDTEIVSPDKIMSQEEIMSSVSEQKASKEVNAVPEITVKEEVQTPK
ncbi:MAG: hypothetical protein IKY98_05145, partial [Alphaproteobacteria bacterium]|nr:hypothetical protein [Alphaproteobacteria bacterium]